MLPIVPYYHYVNPHLLAAELKLEDIFDPYIVCGFAQVCAVGFKRKKDTQYFLEDLIGNATRISNTVINNKFHPTYYPVKVINERGKYRTIQPPTFENKVVQKIVSEYIVRPILEVRMINTSYASIRGRTIQNMYTAILTGLQNAIFNYDNKYVVITDYTNYFGSIQTNKLLNDFSPFIKDQRIIDLIKLYMPNEIGLSLGNELSQVPASYYATPVDRCCKRFTKYYWRYQDDTLAIVNKDQISDYIHMFISKSKELGLTVKPSKISVIKIGHDLQFCKEHYRVKHKHYYRVPNEKLMYRELDKISEVTRRQFVSVRNSIASRPNSYKLVQQLDDAWEERMRGEVYDYS